MHPGTIFNWHDNSAIQIPTTSNVEDGTPLFMQVFSCDKGTEDLIEISGEDFDAMYGTMDFFRYGQSAIQAKNIIDHGGKLYAKRVVAEDSTLANSVLVATVTEATEEDKQKYDKPDAVLKVSWSVQSFETYDDPVTGSAYPVTKPEHVFLAAQAMTDPANGVYALIAYCDNGRGESKKAVRLTPDYNTSRTIGKTFYNLIVKEGSDITETKVISFDPDVIYNDVAYRFDKYTNVQISGEVVESSYELYLNDLADRMAVEPEELRKNDIIYGYTYRGAKMPEFILDGEGADPDAETGIALDKGTNGIFGDGPFIDGVNPSSTEAFEAWTDAVVEVFADDKGDHDEVYDVDQHKLAAVIDANYPDAVKKAIFDFVTFREDCVFLRDYGLGTEDNPLTTYTGIKSRYDEFVADRLQNYFTSDYYTTYNILDPATKKTIKVTMLYDLAACLVDHIKENANAPVAGTINGFILENAIKGTINFTPVITPKGNQKEAIDNIRVNYAIFEDDDCVVQSCYTSQQPYTQLSFLGNVIAIQEVLRAVRTACPKNRFALSTGSDLSNYADAVNDVLSNYVGNFSVLNFIYVQDDLRASQKIFYASIEFAFLNWAQTEIFDIYAING